MSLLSLKRNLTVRNLAANGTNDSDSKWYDDEDAVNDVSAFVHVAAGWRALRTDVDMCIPLRPSSSAARLRPSTLKQDADSPALLRRRNWKASRPTATHTSGSSTRRARCFIT